MTPKQASYLHKLARDAGFTNTAEAAKHYLGVSTDLSVTEASELIDRLREGTVPFSMRRPPKRITKAELTPLLEDPDLVTDWDDET